MSKDEMKEKEMVGGCCVCSDERGWDENPLVYCDGQGCNVAVHQACYGIVTVPSGPWFCRKCESQERSARVKCDLCPSRDGALKRTDQSGWAHVVCALYIPEVRFGNVTTMEPILISLMPPDRFGRSCNICETNNRGSKATAGACMQCNKQGCKQNFHVTCAQIQGLLCEEAGNMDNVKYCGYCQYHYSKLVRKTTRNMKIIPPFRPVPNSIGNASTDSPGSGSSPEKPGSKPGPSANDEKLTTSLQSSSSNLSRNNTPTGTGDYPAKKTGSSNSVSPDIDSTISKNSKSNKKSSGSHSSGSKSSDSSSVSSKSSNNFSITPKIAHPVLTPATFSTASHSHKHVEGKGSEDKSTTDAGPGGQSTSKKSGRDGEISTKDDSFTVKLERVDNPLLKGGSSQSKKDFSTLQLKEVVTAALDKPMSSSKYDHGGSGIVSGIEAAGVSTTSSSHLSSRHSHHGDKPAPPDIKPHVTLTPIPMLGSGSSRISLTRGDSDDRGEEKEPTMTKNKSPVGNSMQFHNSYGQKLQNSGSITQESLDSNAKLSKHSDIISPNEMPNMDKSGPPAKRSRGTSRDDDRGRKTPTKGRGRRGSAHGGYGKRDNYMDENSNEPMDIGNLSSSRGGRNPPGRKPGGSRLMGRQNDDSPSPTLSQLKAQMESAGGDSAGSSVGVLPAAHMFGNALNPASSMAQRMVDTLSQEMEAVAAAGAVGIPDVISPPAPVGIPLPGKATVNGTSSSNSTSLTSPRVNESGSAPPQTLEQLLERQWEQGSQFLMEQAQHLDIAQLLSCLNQLKQDNRALEEHVQTLVQRRDQLIAINARLSVPLGNSSALGVGPLGPSFNNSLNGSNQNGHGTPPPNLSTQVVTPHIPKGLQVNPSTPSPQHHELMMQSTRHGHREERIYHSEMQVSRAEISVAHPTASPHGHGHQSLGRPNVAPYGYPGPNQSGGAGQPPHHSHPPSHHHSRGDGTR